MAGTGEWEALEVLSAPNTHSKFPEGSWDPQNSCPPRWHLGDPTATLLLQGKAERAGGWAVRMASSMGAAAGGQVWSRHGRCGTSMRKVRGGGFPCLPWTPKPQPGAGAGAR